MIASTYYRMMADAVLVLHAGFVAFVVLGLLSILIGGARGWTWVRNPWFRIGHLVAIGVVVLQAWLGVICPLTTWEMELRRKAGDAVYTGSFVAHWVERLLYHDAPAWVFVLCYSLFGLGVLAAWVFVRPRPFRSRAGQGRKRT